MLKIFLFFFSIAIVTSCVTNNKQSSSDNSYSLSSGGKFDAYLEDLLKNQSTGRDFIKNLSKPDMSFENQNKFKRIDGAVKSTNLSRAQLKFLAKSAQKGDLGQFTGLNFNQVIRVFDQIGESHLFNISATLAENEVCTTSADVYFSAATLLEKYFPEESAFSRAISLHRLAAKCSPGDEIRLRSNYRLAMLNLLKSDCRNAQDHLVEVKNFTRTPLTARANYWLNSCENEEAGTGSRRIASENATGLSAEDNMLSFHALLEFKNKNLNPRDLVFTKTQTPVRFRSESAKSLNAYVEGFEYYWPQNKPMAEQYIHKIKTAEYVNAEPEFLIYVGYLSSMVDANLSSFQAFSRAISKKPELKSRATVELFYPRKFKEEIFRYSQDQNIDPLLVMALIRQESAFNIRATSRVGARGLMQIMPKTARTINRRTTKKDLYIPEKNIDLGTRYFAKLLKRYDNNVVHALAAYNAGFGNVDKWIQRYKTTNDLLFMDIIPFQETRDYVSSILRNYYWYSSLENQNLDSALKVGWLNR